ncbi:secretin N-terminal domain-containing protein [Thermogutta sp.]|uniref:secretin N-terminal domain-containing protein n=1 Tax=Thermogutta sp. TaxID=1962930 RepID=UPI003C7BF18E
MNRLSWKRLIHDKFCGFVILLVLVYASFSKTPGVWAQNSATMSVDKDSAAPQVIVSQPEGMAPDAKVLQNPSGDVPKPAIKPSAGQAPESSTSPEAPDNSAGAAGGPLGREQGKGNEVPKGPPPVTRPKEPTEPPEWNVEQSEEGRVRVNFRGQSWPRILEWIADLSHMSLDWQELPGDYLNLTTQQAYTVEELRNLINWHLFQRGYTMIRQGEVLTVVNLDKLDPGIVPHVTPEDLERTSAFEFVRVTFQLDSLVADQAAEELKPLLSPRGKLFPLSATNRLEAMDLAVNLREVARVLRQEQSGRGQERLVREFVLRFARAEETLQQLKDLLGIRDAALPLPPGINPQQLQQLQQMMAAQGGAPPQPGMPGAPGTPGTKGGPSVLRRPSDVNLVVNVRRNSIIAQAPPDKMAIIEQAVKLLDVPSDQDTAILANLNRFQVYRLAALDPEPLVKTLRELGGLDPSTRLEVDKQNNAIIAYAPLADHVVIRSVIERLDGSGRRFEVIQLRRLPADYVAGTIDFMMGGQESSSQSLPPWVPPWERSRRQTETTDRNRFRVDADIENNRLLLWANEIEIQEVQKLLVKLGEISEPGTAGGRVRTLEFGDPAQAEAALQLLQRHWNRISPYPLRVERAPGPEGRSQAPSAKQNQNAPSANGHSSEPQADARQNGAIDEGDGPRADVQVSVRTAVLTHEAHRLEDQTDAEVRIEPPHDVKSIPRPGVGNDLGLVSGELGSRGSDTSEKGDDGQSDQLAPAPAITVYQTPDGRLVFTCPDATALDLVEQFLREAIPPQPDYRIFRLRYAWADNVVKVLESLFSEEEDNRRWLPFWFFDPWGTRGSSDRDRKGRLSQRRPIKFVADTDTNSIVVQNADSRQLAEIKQIIDFYDQPPPTDGQSIRVTEIFALRWAKASQVATAIKDVYRDLLSPNENQRPGERGIVFFFPESGSDTRTPRFKGLLSVGVDETSNCLVVSAPVYLMNDLRELITQLDRNAEPNSTTVEVVRLKNGLSAEHIRRGLGNILSGSNAPPGGPGGKEPASTKSPGESRPASAERKP